MKRNSKSVILTLVALVAALLSGCTTEIKPYSYTTPDPNAEKYQTGDHAFSDKIDSLEIKYSSDDVNVIAYDGDTIKVEEEVHGEYPEEALMHWWFDGTTLRILSHQPGISLSLNLPADHYKILRVYVPESVSLENLDVSISSGDISCEGLKVENADISSSSGDILLKDSEAKKADIDTSSGKVRVEAEVEELNIESSSGNMELKFTTPPKILDASSSSGNITVVLPKSASFKADISTSSGDFNSNIALIKDGKTYTAGDGKADFKFSTSSGDITLREE